VNTWCNPPAQALGDTANHVYRQSIDGCAALDQAAWASDGTCSGGSPAGTFWLSYALGLAANARW
jgi:endoglucanase